METGEPSYMPPMIQVDGSREEMEHPHHQPTSDGVQDNPRHTGQLSSVLPNLRKRKARNSTLAEGTVPRTRQRSWTDEETSALLKFVNLPQFRPQRRTRSTVAWELIVEAIHGELGSADPAITVKRCKERLKTLTGDRYYKQVRSNWEEKKNLGGNLREEDWRKELHACGLRVDWYKAMDEYIQGRPSQGEGMSRMQVQCDLDRNETTDGASSSHILTLNDPSEPVPAMVHTQSPRKAAKNEIARRFESLNDLQRSTLLDFVCRADLYDVALAFNFDGRSVSYICGWLSIMQNRREVAIYEDVMALEKMRLVSFDVDSEADMGEGSDQDLEVYSNPAIDLSSLRVCKEFLKKEIARNPAYDTRRMVEDATMVKFDSSRAPLGITVLYLYGCKELKEADLSCFRMLRLLSIWNCEKLQEIIGWELLNELGKLEIVCCRSCHGYAFLKKIPSVRAFCLSRVTFSSVPSGGELDLSGCVRLRQLHIRGDSALSSILGLEGLRSLTILRLWLCRALGYLPDIGHMKDLTVLEMRGTDVEEVKGVEKLSSLETLNCSYSKLKTLPDLSRLPHLQFVGLRFCPVVNDPSSRYYHKSRGDLHKSKYVDVSDVSDDGGDASD